MSNQIIKITEIRKESKGRKGRPEKDAKKIGSKEARQTGQVKHKGGQVRSAYRGIVKEVIS